MDLNELPRSKLTGYQTNRESLPQLSPPFDTTFPSIRALRATQDGRISINRLSRVAAGGGRASRDSGQTDFFADSPSSHVSVAYRGAGFPLKACGNDGLRKGNKFYAASCGELDPAGIKIFLAKRIDKKYVDGVSFARTSKGNCGFARNRGVIFL